MVEGSLVLTAASLVRKRALNDFLGYSFGPHRFKANGKCYLSAGPSKKGIQRLKTKVRRGAIGERGAIFQLDFKAPSGTTGSDSRPTEALDRDPQSSRTREPGLRKRNQRLGSG
jgi:hypothetical protein